MACRPQAIVSRTRASRLHVQGSAATSGAAQPAQTSAHLSCVSFCLAAAICKPAWLACYRLTFDDLHSSGIYTWQYLHDLGTQKLSRMRRYVVPHAAAPRRRQWPAPSAACNTDTSRPAEHNQCMRPPKFRPTTHRVVLPSCCACLPQVPLCAEAERPQQEPKAAFSRIQHCPPQAASSATSHHWRKQQRGRQCWHQEAACRSEY